MFYNIQDNRSLLCNVFIHIILYNSTAVTLLKTLVFRVFCTIIIGLHFYD